MSKNVAVFVDVANIFYAAKAAGVDIDYVTLLKSATAGRDFVRAYAYTGLDPENENQRQFHAFLARSGYKVISKDIRKYGDGRIKANLDIELVVDMMRMAQHIDIAVVVSGDGDFAPAIRAVQQMGVRAEVISFRGNTSSDLIDVADVFIDITQIARVEKGARSGRRVAAEGDLSMTEVPEKETEGAQRRRRPTRRPERDEHPERIDSIERVERVPVEAGLPGNLIVMPGERLSRVVADGSDGVDELDIELDEAADVAAPRDESASGPRDAETDADGRRRRRRRGGRGRGRGRQGEAEQTGMLAGAAPSSVTAGEPILEDEEFLEEEIAPLPQHSTFGSVWDSQLGVNPAAPMAASAAGTPTEDEDFEDEPEIPEYLLAERRQQQQRGRGRPMRPGQGSQGGQGGRRAGYQSAMDRERYGRPAGSTGGGSGFAAGSSGGPSGFGGTSGGNRADRSRPPMSGGRNNRPPQQQVRPSRPAYQEMVREPERQSSSSEPWSEVPADVQELLRAELARRQGSSNFTQSTPAASRAATPAAEPRAETPEAPKGRRRSTRSAAPEATAAAEAMVAETVAAPARRGRRPAAVAATEAPVSEAPAPAVANATRARKPRAAAAAPAGEPTVAETVAPKARRASTTKARATVAPAAANPAPTDAVPAEVSAVPRKRATRKPAASAGDGEA